jgi:UDP-glucose 4-epimerase
VLVTGGSGFVGSHLAERLVAAGDELTLLDNFTSGRLQNVARLVDGGRVRLVEGDVTDRDLLAELAGSCDVIFHLAAALGVNYVVDQPVQTIQVNVAGTESVLDAALRHNVKVLVASTSEVYGKGAKLPFVEDDDVLLGATSRSRWCYAASKMLDEFLALGYHAQFGLPVVVFRLFNTVGPRQSGRYGMVIPRFVEAALRGGELRVHGDGQQSRCFMHVEDAIRAIDALSTCEAAVGQVFNVGTTRPISISGLAQRVRERVLERTGECGSTIRLVPYSEAYGPGFEDMAARVPCTDKIQRFTGWQPSWELSGILDHVIDAMLEDVMV